VRGLANNALFAAGPEKKAQQLQRVDLLKMARETVTQSQAKPSRLDSKPASTPDSNDNLSHRNLKINPAPDSLQCV